ncbi:hypothetical protein [Asticcacaulis sp.]|uniref:hypothetical protein n=1 Tax=Asticcacaulis sp. TaxID=1872648 RepID=UPI002CD950B3|nr:hypothetical protein [Asticcacaulis sp.]HTM83205.1 hypothetical protein [Asticcacaulis sp.]
MKKKKKTEAKGIKKSDKKLALYGAIKDGAQSGLPADALYQHVLSAVPGAGGKAIVKAALLVLSDPELTDRRVLDVIYDLAIKHRLAEVAAADAAEAAPEVNDNGDEAAVASKKKTSKKAQKAAA